tara:strand:+ start:424 stop:570 length:147 start_codon:yes stop_codon:yes gene_type:complete
MVLSRLATLITFLGFSVISGGGSGVPISKAVIENATTLNDASLKEATR